MTRRHVGMSNKKVDAFLKCDLVELLLKRDEKFKSNFNETLFKTDH